MDGCAYAPPDRMKVLHVVPTYLPARRYGGPIYAVHGLCRALVARGHEVHVFTTNVDGAGDSDVPLGQPVDVDGVQVWYFPSRFLRRLYYAPALARALRRHARDYELIHLHSIYLWPTWIAARIAARFGIPYVVAPRGMLVRELVRRKSRWIKSAWIRLVERRTFARARAIHVTSTREAEEAGHFGLVFRRVLVIPNGVDAAAEDSSRSAPSPAVAAALRRRPLILYLGRINWKKGLERLIAALPQVPDAHLAVAGNDEEGLLPRLVALAAERGVTERVTFLGPVIGADKAALLQGAEVLVLPSLSENFGNVVLEAMAAGCPVAVTPEVGLARVVAESGAGVVSAGDPTALGAALRDMLRDRSELERMGQRGRQRVLRDFTWDAVAAQMEAAYREILQAAGTTSTVPGNRASHGWI